ncbi:T9SS type A sorting domain-containing protein [Tamlana fucoidanivorans]|uniref:T9SS type A sorting domain-containing protein n=1 Tax=Allotamlana fucoidanivorans TaxID=2583814 RepID=A0A5C4SNU8_9FLAO|nr:T9SS type A sorting domain-containing protein [Tamlana fucoidanivorans]TNJ44984.1 T9SS type A sorting domain-containing protein [Tamlana fucoidanivorans]
MKNIKRVANVLIFILIKSMSLVAQTAPCDGLLPFEEQNGILTIEMESGVINHPNWKVDNSVSGYTGDGYIYWDGPESFSSLSNAFIVYNIKINTPGTYRFAWHMKINKGTSKGEHNDAWLKIDADDYYGLKTGHRVIPKPACQTDPNNDCPVGSSTLGFFKIFGNTLDWRFVANTNDGDSHRVFVTFNNPGIYKITLDARSSYCLLDRMVLRLNAISDSVAFNLANNESLCYSGVLSVDNQKQVKPLSLYPNPTTGIVTVANLCLDDDLIVTNIHGIVIRTLKMTKTNATIDLSDLASGIYFVSLKNNTSGFSKKIIKL